MSKRKKHGISAAEKIEKVKALEAEKKQVRKILILDLALLLLLILVVAAAFYAAAKSISDTKNLESAKSAELARLAELAALAESAGVTDVYGRAFNFPDDTFSADVLTIYPDDWAMGLINKTNPLPREYVPEELAVFRGIKMDARVLPFARDMFAAAEADGVTLELNSGYRSDKKQLDTFNNYVERMKREGHSAEEALAITSQQIMPPNCSEHNAGLALDILSPDWFMRHNDITADFEETEQFAWLSGNAYKYGFILRYQKGKDALQDGIEYEPWHYRFVGRERAILFRVSGQTMEEFFDNGCKYALPEGKTERDVLFDYSIVGKD
ncbi:hypothetical protein FACS189499_03230 [Clostridia bacterium]|nr:hypothetical protein FACS189499_03230 [Clostridia bacterium]